MYELLTESKQAIQSYTIDGSIGSVEFDEDDVLKGSLSLSKLCSGTSEFRLGGCYIGQLNISFVGMNVVRNTWEGKEIEITIGIGEKEIPIGVYTVDSASHSKGIVSVTAFDNMDKFEKTFGLDVGVFGQPYDLLVTACETCGVTFGMTRSEVEALPNGNLSLVLNEKGDIETWRDFIYWVSVSLCSFGTMDRNGYLVLSKFHSSVDDTIPYDVRFNTSSYSDEIITYTGVTVFVSSDGSLEYYHAETDNGYTLNIGNNPFFQTTKAQRQVYIGNILNALSEIQFISGSVKVPFGFHYDLGDVLQFPNGQGSATNKFCVMGVSLKYNGECILSGIPGQKNSQSKTDKNLQGLLTTVSKNEFTSYELRNTAPISIGEDENVRLLLARIASNTQTKAQIHIEVNLESEAIEDYTQGVVTYLVNSEDVEFYPTETWIDGNHIMHLMYILPLQANDIQYFEVYMKALGGSIEIPRGGVWLYASGAGLVGDGKWDGTLTFIDEVERWTIPNIIFRNANDSVDVDTQTPTASSILDSTSRWNIPTITFESAEDSMYIEMHTDVFRRITEDGDVRVTNDDDVRYTEGD